MGPPTGWSARETPDRTGISLARPIGATVVTRSLRSPLRPDTRRREAAVADVRVLGAKVSAGRIEALRVGLAGLPERTLDRTAVLKWMKDGHSFVPVVAGSRRPALQLVEVGDEWFVRTDHSPEAADRLPELPGV